MSDENSSSGDWVKPTPPYDWVIEYREKHGENTITDEGYIKCPIGMENSPTLCSAGYCGTAICREGSAYRIQQAAKMAEQKRIIGIVDNWLKTLASLAVNTQKAIFKDILNDVDPEEDDDEEEESLDDEEKTD